MNTFLSLYISIFLKDEENAVLKWLEFLTVPHTLFKVGEQKVSWRKEEREGAAQLNNRELDHMRTRLFKGCQVALVGVAQWIECQPASQSLV